MHTVPIFQVDAFADALFAGNPAAVVLLQDDWLPDRLMQQIAAENNLAETAFLLGADQPPDEPIGIRWFTPTTEVDLCGHATLASAFVVAMRRGEGTGKGEGTKGEGTELVIFDSPLSGRLPVAVEPGEPPRFVLDFPADPVERVEVPAGTEAALGVEPVAAYCGRTDLMFVVAEARTVAELKPDLARIAGLPARGVIVTAAATSTGDDRTVPGADNGVDAVAGAAAGASGGAGVDFVSRFFAPQSGIPEDPVTGSAHTTLAPFWAAELGRHRLSARQLSARGGTLICEVRGERVHIAGTAALYLRGEVVVPEARGG